MIRRSPCERYLVYLIVHGDAYTNDQIREIIHELQLDFVGNWYIERLRATVLPPSPFYPTDPLHSASQRFLLRERIRDLFHPNDEVRLALKVLELPRVKEFIEAMVLSGAPDAAITYALGVQRGFRCTNAVLERYKHYFWNTELLDSTDMRALLRLRVEAAQHSKEPEIQMQMSALHKASFNDPRKVAADLPASPITALMSQMRMGLMPSSIELSKVLETLRAAASIRALEATLNGGPDDSLRALNYSGVVRVATETLEHVAKPDQELREDLGALTLRTEQIPPPVIHQLSSGHHTVDLEPPPKEEVHGAAIERSSEGPASSGA
jgi:ribosomal protein L20